MFLTADNIHDGRKFLAAGAAIEVLDDGTIKSVIEQYTGEAKHYAGILCPGFVNAHCHLELSHLKGLIPKHTGLVPFLLQVIKGRGGFTEEEKTYARVEAYETLWHKGISAVGDIANTTDSMDVRTLGKMNIHTFVEAIGFNEHWADKSFEHALTIYRQYRQQASKTCTQSIVPHAPYSVSEKLFTRINDFEKDSIISIHNQETAEEDKFYMDQSGGINDLLNGLGIDSSAFRPSGKSSLQTYTQWIDSSHPVIFVHDSYTKKEDVNMALQRFPNAYFCLCPNANLYIENTLPDVNMLIQAGAPVCIGTDSLASNDALCMYSELKALHEHFRTDWETLLKWACYNGATALQLEDRVGRFAAGMKPGVVNIVDNVSKRVV